MQLLNPLQLVHYEHPTHRDPRLHLRHNLLAKLDEQVSASQKQRVSTGKNAGELASEAELVGTLEQISTAVEQREFDELIEQQAALRNCVNTMNAKKLKQFGFECVQRQ